MKREYRLSFGMPGSDKHETLRFGAGGGPSLQMRAARELVRVLRTVTPNVKLQVKVSVTEWDEVRVD